MIITYKILLNDGSYKRVKIQDVARCHLSRRCCFYWLRGKDRDMFTINLTSLEDVNIYQDDECLKEGLK